MSVRRPNSGAGAAIPSVQIFQPFGGGAPQGIAVFGAEKAEMADRVASVSSGAMLMISGRTDSKPAHSISTAGRVAQGSSVKHSARSAPR